MTEVVTADCYGDYVDSLARSLMGSSGSAASNDTIQFAAIGDEVPNFDLVSLPDNEDGDDDAFPFNDDEDVNDPVLKMDDGDVPMEIDLKEGPFNITKQEAEDAPAMLRQEFEQFCGNFFEKLLKKYPVEGRKFSVPDFWTFIVFRRMLITIAAEPSIPQTFYDGEKEGAMPVLNEVMERGRMLAKQYLDTINECPLKEALASIVSRVEAAHAAIRKDSDLEYAFDVSIDISTKQPTQGSMSEETFKNVDIVTSKRMTFDVPITVARLSVSKVQSFYMWVSSEKYDPFVVYVLQKIHHFMNPTDILTKARVAYRQDHINQLPEQHMHDLLVSVEGTRFILDRFEETYLLEFM